MWIWIMKIFRNYLYINIFLSHWRIINTTVLFWGKFSNIQVTNHIFISIIQSSWKESKETPGKKIYFCFTNYVKAFDVVNHTKLWKIVNKMGLPYYLTCLLENLYMGQGAIVRHGKTDCFKTPHDILLT